MATKTPAWQKAYLNQPAAQPSFQVGSVPQQKYTPPTGMQAAAQPAAQPAMTTAQPWMNQAQAPPKPNDDLEPYMKAYLDNVNKPVTPFKYDEQSDPAYQAALRTAETNSKQAAGNIAADMNKRGLLNSTITADRGNQAAQAEYSRVSDTILPQLRNQAYGEYQDVINQDRNKNQDLMGWINARYGMNQDQFNNNLATNADNRATQGQDFSQGVTKAGLTGYYGDASGVKQKMNANSAAWANASPEEQQRLHNENLGLAGSVGSTYDPQTGEYSAPQGQRTMAGQELDFTQGLQNRDQQLQETQVMAQLTGMLPDGTPTTAEQQRLLANEWQFAESQGVIGEKLGGLYNLPANTPTQAAKSQAAQLAISQQNANTSSYSAANSAANAANSNTRANNAATDAKESQRIKNLYEIWDRTGEAPEGIPGVAKGTAIAGKTPVPTQTSKNNAIYADMVQVIDGLDPSGMKEFFTQEKQNILRDLGPEGYERLYGTYQNKFRNLK